MNIINIIKNKELKADIEKNGTSWIHHSTINIRNLRFSSTLVFPKHWDGATFNMLRVDWVCHRIARSIRLSAHVVFWIQTVNQSLIGVAIRSMDGWDRKMMKVKKEISWTQTNRTEHDFVTIRIFSFKKCL